jgi:hypothetical protein
MLEQYWLESGLVGYLEAEVRVERGRMGLSCSPIMGSLHWI